MSYRKFGDKDVLINTMRTFPHCHFVIFDSAVYYNNIAPTSGSKRPIGPPATAGQAPTFIKNVKGSNWSGSISLYEYNIDRAAVTIPVLDRSIGQTTELADTGLIYPFISKDSARTSFRTANGFESTNPTTYNNEFQYGEILTGHYPLSASISRRYITTPSASLPGTDFDARYVALRNKLNYYKVRSEHYAVSSSAGLWNKNTQTLNMISIPSIFYGAQIYPGSVSLKWYFTGSLIGELKDINENGELIQTGPYGSLGSGNVGGVALYDEGILLLTGSWQLNKAGSSQIDLALGVGSQYPRWIHFAAGANDGVNQTTAGGVSFRSASFEMSFKGRTDTQVTTMFAHAKRGQVNYSNNPTFLQFNQNKLFFTSSHIYQENKDVKLKNFVSSSHSDYSASFKRQVFVSRVGVYDKNKNLVGVASLANPVLKKEAEDISFKLKLDI